MTYTIDPATFRDTTLDEIVTQYGDPDKPVYALRSGRHVHTGVTLCQGCDTPVEGSFCGACDEWVGIPVLTPITTRARKLDPAIWGNIEEDDE